MAEDLREDPLLRDVPESDGRKLLDSCVLEELIGRGGMGAVYLARHRTLEIDVAVKCLLPAIAMSNPDMVARFEREAKLAARINHPNIVRVFDVNHRHGLHYIVMEYVSGETARGRVIRKGCALAVGEAVIIALEAAKGLAAVHAEGIVHRDIKPDNILISKRGEVKLADLGLSCLRAEAGAGSSLTLSGVAIGTPRYMPPEQWEGLVRVGPAGDIWALGATLYFLLAGEEAWPGSAPADIMRRICTEPFPDVRRKVSSLPKGLSEIIERATAREPANRYPTAAKLVEDLEKLALKHGLKGSLEALPSDGTRTAAGVVSPPPRTPRSRSLEATASLVVPATSARDRAGHARITARRTIEACVLGAAFAFAAMFVARFVPTREDGGYMRVAEAETRSSVTHVEAQTPAPEVQTLKEPEKQPIVETKPEPPPEPKAAVREEPTPPPAPSGPELRVERPADGVWTSSPIEAAGTLACADDCALEVDGQQAAVRAGRWTIWLQLPDGDRPIVVMAQGSRGRAVIERRVIHIDTVAPSIELIAPSPGAAVRTRQTELLVRARISDRGPIRKVLIGGAAASREADGVFATIVPLAEGAQQILIEAVDLAGNAGTLRFEARREEPPPPEPHREFGPLFDDTAVRLRDFAARDIPGFTRLTKDARGCQEYRHDRTGIVMVFVPGGIFSMGSTPGEQAKAGVEIDAREKEARTATFLKRALSSEGPRHEVRLDAFLIAKEELSQRAWRAIMGTDPSHKKGDTLPVESISWIDAKEFCRRAGLALPTEAQWECACRAAAPPTDAIALSGMLGGVAEWCEDEYREAFYSTPEAGAPNPLAAASSKFVLRAVRGGAWTAPDWARRPASREGAPPDRKSPFRGLRPAFHPIP